MKGVVFTELMDLVEETWGADALDRVIDAADPPNGGAYTAVGTYPHSEVVALVRALEAETGLSVPQLLHAFGRHLTRTFARSHAAMFDRCDDALALLESIDQQIHVEVRKLYPDAELPRIETSRTDQGMEVIYRSPRAMGSLAHGLIESTLDYYGHEGASVHVAGQSDDGTEVRFQIVLEG
jgi:hypothetical protein